jgi:hypothetical protein
MFYRRGHRFFRATKVLANFKPKLEMKLSHLFFSTLKGRSDEIGKNKL